MACDNIKTPRKANMRDIPKVHLRPVKTGLISPSFDLNVIKYDNGVDVSESELAIPKYDQGSQANSDNTPALIKVSPTEANTAVIDNTLKVSNNLSTTSGNMSSAGTVSAVGNISTSAGNMSSAGTVSAVGNISTSSGNVSSAGTVSAVGDISTSTGDISTSAGNISSAGTVSAVGNISTSAGNISSAGTVSATGNISSSGIVSSSGGGFQFPDATVQTTAATGGSGAALYAHAVKGVQQDIIVTNVIQLVDFGPESDPHGWINQTIASSIQPNVAGVYVCSYTVGLTKLIPSTNQWVLFLRKNGSSVFRTNHEADIFASDTTIVTMNGTTDYVQVFIQVATNIPQSLAAATMPRRSTFILYRIGDIP